MYEFYVPVEELVACNSYVPIVCTGCMYLLLVCTSYVLVVCIY